jgi:hypothetical protein
MAEVYISVALQRAISSLSDDHCEYCWYPAAFSPSSFHYDHIDPLANDGATILENLARACAGCNGLKQDKTHYYDPVTFQFTRLYHPRKQSWHDHFQWSDDELLIIGTSPAGRATVELLQVNRQANINLRQLLIPVGLHPPKTIRQN